MKVLITGAAGRIGSEAVRQCVSEGWEVVATDVRASDAMPVPLHEMNLLDENGVAGLMQGVQAVVHLGNHIGIGKTGRSPATTFNENASMNMNVFQAALDAGARTVVFASSVQVIASEIHGGTNPAHANKVAYLPLDGDSPANPSNAYALSKAVAETMLRQYLVPFGITCVALRYPRTCSAADFDTFRPFNVADTHREGRITQGFSVLSAYDAASAVVACLKAKLTEYHLFFPAVSQAKPEHIPSLVQRYYRDVPLRKPIGEMQSLIDISQLTRATGWRPRDVI